MHHARQPTCPQAVTEPMCWQHVRATDRTYPAPVDKRPADLEMVAGLLDVKLIKLFEANVRTAASVRAVRAACQETRHQLDIMAKHDLMSADESGLPAYRSAGRRPGRAAEPGRPGVLPETAHQKASPGLGQEAHGRDATGTHDVGRRLVGDSQSHRPRDSKGALLYPTA
jgi:hypothetical protein